MEKAELKRLLRFAKDEPVNVALAIGEDGKAVLRMDKRKPPRTLERGLKEEEPGSKSHRFGTAIVDADSPKLVRFVVNKAGPGLARKLVVALKGTGYTTVRIELEDGTALEAEEGRAEEDGAEEDGAEDDGAEDGAEDGADDEAPPPRAEGSERDGGEAQALRTELAGLVREMLEAIKRDPSQRAALVELATDAQASLKAGDLAQADAGIDILRLAIDSAGSPRADGGGRDALDEDTATKAGHVWARTRARIHAEIGKLQSGIVAHYDGHPGIADIGAAATSGLESILDRLDARLTDQLHAYARLDGSRRREAAAAIRDTLQDYRDFAAGSPLVQEIDDNPFVPVAVRKTIEASISALSRSIG